MTLALMKKERIEPATFAARGVPTRRVSHFCPASLASGAPLSLWLARVFEAGQNRETRRSVTLDGKKRIGMHELNSTSTRCAWSPDARRKNWCPSIPRSLCLALLCVRGEGGRHIGTPTRWDSTGGRTDGGREDLARDDRRAPSVVRTSSAPSSHSSSRRESTIRIARRRRRRRR